MNKLFVVFVGLIVAANAVSFFDVVKEEWHAFKVRMKSFIYDSNYIYILQLCIQFDIHLTHEF